mmetsp:Transcript_87999/g.152458  ORF Transcript_87999/g.152458 Transcript_87999/m.152458 type:complete len:226 (-) Transcript_87999:27-704(-)
MSGTLLDSRGKGLCTASKQSSKSSSSPSLSSRMGPVLAARDNCNGPASSKLLGTRATSSSATLSQAARSAVQYLIPQHGCPSRPQVMQIKGLSFGTSAPSSADTTLAFLQRRSTCAKSSATPSLLPGGTAGRPSPVLPVEFLPSAPSPGSLRASLLASMCVGPPDSRPEAPHSHLGKKFAVDDYLAGRPRPSGRCPLKGTRGAQTTETAQEGRPPGRPPLMPPRS